MQFCHSKMLVQKVIMDYFSLIAIIKNLLIFNTDLINPTVLRISHLVNSKSESKMKNLASPLMRPTFTI